MCFSEMGSFGTGVGLVGIGIYTLARVARVDRGGALLAALPLGFGLQQVAEGFVWHALNQGDVAAVRSPALAFLAFSHGAWLVWVPLAVAAVEADPRRRRLFLAITAAGAALGAMMYGSILTPEGFRVEVLFHSIRYRVALITDGIVPRGLVEGLYAAVILGPLLGASRRRVRWFGLVVAISAGASLAVFHYAFASVWCFFAAVLSSTIPWVCAERSEGESEAAVGSGGFGPAMSTGGDRGR